MSSDMDVAGTLPEGRQYLALQAIADLSRDVLEIGGDAPGPVESLAHVEAFERALRNKNYTTQQLVDIQTIMTGRMFAVARTISRQHR